MAVESLLSASDLSSLEAMLLQEYSSMGTPPEGAGGDETSRDDDGGVTVSPPLPSLPPLPARPAPRGRLPSLPRLPGWAPWTPPPPSPSPHKEGDTRRREVERKAVEITEARLREKEAENAALRREIESYHVRWLEYEIKINSLEEAFHEQMARLQMAREEAARRAPTCDRRRLSSSDEQQAPARLRRGSGATRAAAVGRQSQALENGAAGVVETSGANSGDDLRKLKAQFRAWKKSYKARLRSAKAEIDRDRRRRSACWI